MKTFLEHIKEDLIHRERTCLARLMGVASVDLENYRIVRKFKLFKKKSLYRKSFGKYYWFLRNFNFNSSLWLYIFCVLCISYVLCSKLAILSWHYNLSMIATFKTVKDSATVKDGELLATRPITYCEIGRVGNKKKQSFFLLNMEKALILAWL